MLLHADGSDSGSDMPGKLTLMWRRMNAAELGKDVVLVPGYLGRMLGMDVDIVCSYPDDVSRQAAAMGVGIVQRPMSFKKALRIPVNVCYLLANARRIDVLMCFHWRLETIINVLLYKFLNPHGKVYVKLDTANGNEFDNPSKKQLFAKALSKVDVMSCELSWVYDKLLANSAYGDIFRDRLLYVPNGFDEDRLQTMLPQLASLKKENIILCVGRAGAHHLTYGIFDGGIPLRDLPVLRWGHCNRGIRCLNLAPLAEAAIHAVAKHSAVVVIPHKAVYDPYAPAVVTAPEHLAAVIAQRPCAFHAVLLPGTEYHPVHIGKIVLARLHRFIPAHFPEYRRFKHFSKPPENNNLL